MTPFYGALAVVGGLLLALSVTSGLIKSRLLASEPLVALLVGVAVGPQGLDLLGIGTNLGEARFIEAATRITLAITLMGVALRLPKRYVRRHWRTLALLLGVVMPVMWLVSSAVAWLVLGVPVLVALVIGAVVTPTDPVVASSIVAGDYAERNLPDRLRHLLSAESGFNDGLALPFVLLPVLLLDHAPGEALVHWLRTTLLWEVGFAIAFGIGIGWLTGRIRARSRRRLGIERGSLLSISLALSLATLGIVKLLGSDAILATFVAGLAFDWFADEEMPSDQPHTQDIVARFFDLPIFVLFGLALPWGAWQELGWAGLATAALVLLLRRLPILLAVGRFISPIRHRMDTLFAGWFGPIGVAALFYASLVLGRTGNQTVWEVGSLVVFASLVVHGVSATPLTGLYGRRRSDRDA